MKKFLLGIVGLFFLCSSAQAVPYSWTDTITVDDPILFAGPHRDGAVQEYSFTHDITDEGFTPPGTPFVDPNIHDWVTDIQLTLKLYDDATGNGADANDSLNNNGKIPDEGVDVVLSGRLDWFDSNHSGRIEIDYTDIELGWNLLGIIELNLFGQLSVELSRTDGDFVFAGSTLVASGNESNAPVPEPATIFLMGLGLLSIVGIRKRKNS